MKKSFLMAGLIAGLTATNGYAVQSNSSIDIKLICPAGCHLMTTQAGDHITAWCVSDTLNKDCGDPKISTESTALSDDLIQEIKQEIKKGKKPISARVAKVKQNVKSANADTPSAPINKEPEVKVSSGLVVISCPEGCKPDCYDDGSNHVCKCKKPNGELCQESILTSENTIHK